MKYEKLSEKVLPDLIKALFPAFKDKVITQKRIKGLYNETMIIDAALETDVDKFFFEFDGPTHYQQTKTQIRDQNLQEYCNVFGIKLIRFPYFAQFNRYDVGAYFDDVIDKRYGLNDLSNYIECEYEWGFHDEKIVYPADFNQSGWELFFNFYEGLAKRDKFYNMQKIYETLVENVVDVRFTIGLDYKTEPTKILFVENYPT
jgi:hypothetical protein